jgi:hypothetical protein
MVDFRNQTIVNVIPDGLNGGANAITPSNGGDAGFVGFTLVNGQGNTVTVQVLQIMFACDRSRTPQPLGKGPFVRSPELCRMCVLTHFILVLL